MGEYYDYADELDDSKEEYICMPTLQRHRLRMRIMPIHKSIPYTVFFEPGENIIVKQAGRGKMRMDAKIIEIDPLGNYEPQPFEKLHYTLASTDTQRHIANLIEGSQMLSAIVRADIKACIEATKGRFTLDSPPFTTYRDKQVRKQLAKVSGEAMFEHLHSIDEDMLYESIAYLYHQTRPMIAKILLEKEELVFHNN